MTTRKAAKRKTTPNPPAIAVAPVATPVNNCGSRNPSICEVEALDSNRSGWRSCVISLYPDHYRLHTCDHCGAENSETVWFGVLSDTISMSQGYPTDIALINSDDILGGRTNMVPRLQRRAHELGFKFCEVREYSLSDPDDYVPLFGGPIPVLNVAP